jgi:DNA-binding NarL/FixJ family response regulator
MTTRLVRRAIRTLLAEHPEIELVGEATGFSETFQMVDRLGQQVVLLNLHMKDGEDLSPEEINHRLTRNASVVGMSRNHHSVGVVSEQATGFPGYNSIIEKNKATFGHILLNKRLSHASWFGKNHARISGQPSRLI